MKPTTAEEPWTTFRVLSNFKLNPLYESFVYLYVGYIDMRTNILIIYIRKRTNWPLDLSNKNILIKTI